VRSTVWRVGVSEGANPKTPTHGIDRVHHHSRHSTDEFGRDQVSQFPTLDRTRQRNDPTNTSTAH
uniref:Uncharacterized protein n=1 Tax=Anopheles minimus TaxID=112268 RepID=A0A182W769_9DIPT